MTLLRHAWLVSLVVVACAPTTVRWEKAGTPEATAQADLEQCRQAARFAPMTASLLRPPATSVATRALTREEELDAHETEEFQKCMRDKGYSAKR